MTTPPARTLKDFADFAWKIRQRCTMHDGTVAASTALFLTAEEVETIAALQERLDQMVPHATAIRRVVTGR